MLQLCQSLFFFLEFTVLTAIFSCLYFCQIVGRTHHWYVGSFLSLSPSCLVLSNNLLTLALLFDIRFGSIHAKQHLGFGQELCHGEAFHCHYDTHDD